MDRNDFKTCKSKKLKKIKRRETNRDMTDALHEDMREGWSGVENEVTALTQNPYIRWREYIVN